MASRNAKQQCDAGRGVGPTGRAVYLDFDDAIKRDGKDEIERRYGNLFDMYRNIIDENETYSLDGNDPNMSFPEMLDSLNEQLISEDKSAIEFGNDCREGICGACGAMINGIAHGPGEGTALCQLHMRALWRR